MSITSHIIPVNRNNLDEETMMNIDHENLNDNNDEEEIAEDKKTRKTGKTKKIKKNRWFFIVRISYYSICTPYKIVFVV